MNMTQTAFHTVPQDPALIHPYSLDDSMETTLESNQPVYC